MLSITVPATTNWDEAKEEFVTFQGEVLMLEHSLVAVSKWEEFTERPFLVKGEKSTEDIVKYVECMTISPVNDPNVYANLSMENFAAIDAYINLKMTATWFRNEGPQRPSGEIITAEIIYYWMIALNIPTEYRYWHIQKLLTLVKVLNLKNAPPKKEDRASMLQRQRELNEQRQAALNTTG